MGAVAGEAFRFDPADVIEDPYPAYSWLREHDPVHLGATGLWYLTRHADVFAALHDARLGSDGRADPVYAEQADAVFGGPHTPAAHWFILHALRLDGPVHASVRRIIQEPFLLPSVRSLESRIQAVVDDIVSAVEGRDEFDFIEEIARPLPTAVVCEILGVPRSEWKQCERWTAELTDGLSMLAHHPERMATINASIAEFESYFASLIAARRRQPRDDFLTRLSEVDCREAGITEEQLLVNATAIFVAARETTIGALGNGMLELLRHPDQLARLRSKPDMAMAAVDETLRYQTPLLQVRRSATEDVSFGGMTIPAGSGVMLLLGAAHFDPRRYDEPGRFDISRSVDGLVSFGFGAHFCIGAHLARREIAMAFRRLVESTTSLEWTGVRPRWIRSPIIRALETLPIAAVWR
jgi:cytochrome P450